MFTIPIIGATVAAFLIILFIASYVKSLLSGMFGAKLIGNNGVTVNVEDVAE